MPLHLLLGAARHAAAIAERLCASLFLPPAQPQMLCLEHDRRGGYAQQLTALADRCRSSFPRCAVQAGMACWAFNSESHVPWFIRQVLAAMDIDTGAD